MKISGHCGVCDKELSDDPESLHYNCGGDCRWCMAKSGDPGCQESVTDHFRELCLGRMSDVYKQCVMQVNEVGGDAELFGIQIMEQWRPW